MPTTCHKVKKRRARNCNERTKETSKTTTFYSKQQRRRNPSEAKQQNTKEGKTGQRDWLGGGTELTTIYKMATTKMKKLKKKLKWNLKKSFKGKKNERHYYSTNLKKNRRLQCLVTTYCDTRKTNYSSPPFSTLRWGERPPLFLVCPSKKAVPFMGGEEEGRGGDSTR